MNTTDEIMAQARSYRDAQPGLATTITFLWLETAISDLVEQAKWAHHTPALLSDADAAADLAGVARPGAEPVAWRHDHGEENGGWEYYENASCADCQPLYTAPPQASQPLTDKEWFDFWKDNDAAPGNSVFPEFLRLARAIEATHGIGAAQKGKP